MPIREADREAIATLVQVEEDTGRLYRRYAECAPEHAAFWNGLAVEEDHHAAWVRHLLTKLEDGALAFRDGRFTPDTFHTFRDYLRERIAEAERECSSLIAALSIAVDIESAFVERGFFDIFEGDDPQVRTLLQRLSDSSAEHLRRVQEYLTRQRLAKA